MIQRCEEKDPKSKKRENEENSPGKVRRARRARTNAAKRRARKKGNLKWEKTPKNRLLEFK
jgi:hypothetical protein